jgi:hypothetical protein
LDRLLLDTGGLHPVHSQLPREHMNKHSFFSLANNEFVVWVVVHRNALLLGLLRAKLDVLTPGLIESTRERWSLTVSGGGRPRQAASGGNLQDQKVVAYELFAGCPVVLPFRLILREKSP